MFSQNFSNEIAILSTNRLLNIPYVHPIVCFMTQVRRILQRPQFQFPPFNFRYLWSRRTDRYAFMWGFIAATLVCRESFTDQCDQFLLLESCSGRGSLFTTFSPFFLSGHPTVRDLLEMCWTPRVICPFLVLYCG